MNQWLWSRAEIDQRVHLNLTVLARLNAELTRAADARDLTRTRIGVGLSDRLGIRNEYLRSAPENQEVSHR